MMPSRHLPERPSDFLFVIIREPHPADESLLEIVPAEETRAMIGEGRDPIQQHRRPNLLPIQRRVRQGHDAAMRTYMKV